MLVTIDTNVLFQALFSSTGASNYILQLVRKGDITIALSIPVYREYKDVLKRKRSLEFLRLSEDDIDAVLEFIVMISKPFTMNYLWRPNLKDEGDNIFAELAFNSSSRYLITKNIKDFSINNDLTLDSYKLITPSDFAKQWRFLYEEK